MRKATKVTFVFIVFDAEMGTAGVFCCYHLVQNMPARELRTELLTIRLTQTEKQKVEEACRLQFELRLPLATLARELLLRAVEGILKRKRHA